MRARFIALSLSAALAASHAIGGDAEVRAAQGTIDAQLQALRAGDGAKAYSFAAPTIQRIFPTAEIFMEMVERGYPPVRAARSYAFGKFEETAAGSITQQVLIVGPDGKDYEAVYTLELQPDGVYRITSVSLRASNSLST